MGPRMIVTDSARRRTRYSAWLVLARLIAVGGVLGAAGGITFGYLGWLHPAFDSFSHFRIHLSAGLLALVIPLLVLRFVPEAIFAALLGATAIVQTTGVQTTGLAAGLPVGVGVDGGAPAAPVYRLLQINLRFDNPAPERALSLIGSLRPDVVTLNEVSAPWEGKLELLKAAYPYRVICPPPAHVGGSAILSRRPFAAGTEPSCWDRGSFARAQVDFGGSIVEIAALHMGWPWPFEQPWQLPHIEPVLAELSDTAILAGDFNAVPWSRTTRRLAEASGTHVLRGIGPTWLSYRLPDALRGMVGLPIDNILVKGALVPVAWRALDDAGSDHLPVLLEFSLLPQEEPASVLQAAAGQ